MLLLVLLQLRFPVVVVALDVAAGVFIGVGGAVVIAVVFAGTWCGCCFR